MESAATLLYSDETLYDGPVFFYDYEDYFPPPDFSSEIPIFSAEDISFLGPASLFTAFGSGDATALSVSKVDSATSSHRPPDLSLLPLPPNGTYQYGVLNHNRIYHPKQQVTDAQYRLVRDGDKLLF